MKLSMATILSVFGTTLVYSSSVQAASNLRGNKNVQNQDKMSNEEPADIAIKIPSLADEEEQKESDDRRLGATSQCAIYANGKYKYFDAGASHTCYNLGNDPEWNDKATWIRGDENTCIYVYEHVDQNIHDGHKLRRECGTRWYQLNTNYLSREVSQVCCNNPSMAYEYPATTTSTTAATTTTTIPTTTTQPTTPSSNNGCGINSETNQIYALTNQYRAENGLHVLECNTGLSNVIQDYLQTLCAHGAFTHNFGGTTIDSRLQEAGIHTWVRGENLGEEPNYYTAEQTINGWKGSYYHNQAMLNSRINTIGVGRLTCGNKVLSGQLFAGIW